MCTVSRFLFCGVQNVRVLRADVRTGRPAFPPRCPPGRFSAGSRGKSCRKRLPSQGPILPIRGKCPEGTKGVGMLSAKQTERSLQICIEKIQTANSVCGLERLTIKCQVWNVRSGKNFRRIKKGIAKQTSRWMPNWAYRRMDLRSVTIWLLGFLHRVN